LIQLECSFASRAALSSRRLQTLAQVSDRRPDCQQRLVVEVLVAARRRIRACAGLVHPAPAPQREPPPGGELGENAETGAHVLGALGVVRRAAEHRVGPIARAVRGRGMEILERHAELARVVADLVQRREPAVAVEGRVLVALRHHRRGELLEARGEFQHPPAARAPRRARRA
jgi:hypothetical protein